MDQQPKWLQVLLVPIQGNVGCRDCLVSADEITFIGYRRECLQVTLTVTYSLSHIEKVQM